MTTEFEVKFLEIDGDALRQKLISVGAQNIYRERLMKRNVYMDEDPTRLSHQGKWLRLRDEGDKITLTLKQEQGYHIESVKEVEIEINDFEKAHTLVLGLGFIQKSYQETRREKWILDDVEIVIDTWPWIPTFVEIEGKNKVDVQEVSGKLEMEWDKRMFGGVAKIYRKYFQIDEDTINNFPRIVFDDPAPWEKIK